MTTHISELIYKRKDKTYDLKQLKCREYNAILVLESKFYRFKKQTFITIFRKNFLFFFRWKSYALNIELEF